MSKRLKLLYSKFLEFDKSNFFKDYKYWLGTPRVSKRKLEEIYSNYYRPSFAVFLIRIKNLVYSKQVFDFILKNSVDAWDLWAYLTFLKKEKLIKLAGKRIGWKSKIFDGIPNPQSEEVIKKKVERKLGVRIRGNEPITSLFKKHITFRSKATWDQMPIASSSAIFLVKKILDWLPLNKKFLFVGDDDFISILLCSANPSIEALVVDVDESLLSSIEKLALKLDLKIETSKEDVRKKRKIGEFIGFLCNPPYTEAGVESFLDFGLEQLGKDGGVVFLEFSEDTIGNRTLFLQKFFARKRLIILEAITKHIFYPWRKLLEEDRIITKRFSRLVGKRNIKDAPMLAANLFVFEYLPFRPKPSKFGIYSYI